jgi:hypothetical protein
MRRALILMVLAGCGGGEEKKFGLDPPVPGAQIHFAKTTLEAGTSRTVCEERTLSNAAAGDAGPGAPLLVPHVELLARPPLKSLEVYALGAATGEPPADCPMLPVNVMGQQSEPIRMIYYAAPVSLATDAGPAQADEVQDDFRYPGGAAVSLDPDQVVLLRYTIQAGDQPEDLEFFLNFYAVAEADVVARPYAFSFHDINVPPMQNDTGLPTTCAFIHAETVLTVAAHQHSHLVDGVLQGAGTGVTVEFGGQVLLDDRPGRTGPWAVLDPLAVPEEQGLTFTCSYDNRSSDPVVYGTSEFDEMCRIFGWLTGADGPILGTAHNEAGLSVCDVVEEPR